MGARLHLVHVIDLPFGLRPDSRVHLPGQDAPDLAWVSPGSGSNVRLGAACSLCSISSHNRA